MRTFNEFDSTRCSNDLSAHKSLLKISAMYLQFLTGSVEIELFCLQDGISVLVCIGIGMFGQNIRRKVKFETKIGSLLGQTRPNVSVTSFVIYTFFL